MGASTQAATNSDEGGTSDPIDDLPFIDGANTGQVLAGLLGLSGNTSFTHIDPLSPAPVPLSKFLTGGGPSLTFNVNDPQFGSSVVWRYADLQRRLQRLFDLAFCTPCILPGLQGVELIDQIRAWDRSPPTWTR